jgi:hypothetical protein
MAKLKFVSSKDVGVVEVKSDVVFQILTILPDESLNLRLVNDLY